MVNGRSSLCTFLLSFIFSSLILFADLAQAEYKWGFANLSYNYLDWDKGTESKSTKSDFSYVEIEGGSQFHWGELYGFYDIENVGKTGDDMRTASKGSIRYYLTDSNLNSSFSLYAHVYNFTSLGFAEQNRVIGFGYQLTGKDWWFKPFLGVHEVSQTFFNGFNGYMGGWILGYGFTVLEQSFFLSNWHEIEFSRKESYSLSNGSSKVSHNGALALWWNACKELTLGAQFRYATDKLGTAGSMTAAISTVKYNF